MHKILVEVYNPASNHSFDVFIPLKSKIYEVTYLLSNTVTELSQGHYKATQQTALCDRITGQVFDINMTIEEIGLKNGSKLMLL
ncbi:methyltransferase [Neobacillus bataviensis]|uniref:methyltransferase n=1 Tax=Neobacillus bataviensis TaxID=220685 RepID=UPI001CBBCAA3|nr:methyltransferase [Neobacillus bataviensis]